MSAPNFRTMDNFPLFAIEPEDELDAYETCREVEERLDNINDGLLFHKISVESGYYCGLQLFVDELHDPNEYDNEDCRWEFDLCRSVAIRRYNSEINKINRELRKLARFYGFDELYCAALFSSGEAVYRRVENTVRSRIDQAAARVRVAEAVAQTPLIFV